MEEQDTKKREEALKSLDEISEVFNRVMKQEEEAQEKLWNSLSMEDQISLFCAVSRRIYKGEIEEGRSYRGVLYTTFGFDTSAYALAQYANYLDIHNLIMSPSEEKRLMLAFANYLGVTSTPEVVEEFLRSGARYG